MEIAGVEAGTIEVVTLKQGDVVFVISDRPLSAAAVEKIHEQFRGLLPKGVKVGVIQEGMKISVVRPESGNQDRFGREVV